MSTGQKSVIVVGAGIIGSAIGYELQRRGHAVTLVDRQAPGRGTSYGNMASLAVSEIMAVSRPATWKKIPGWMLDPEGPVWLRPSYAPRMAGWFLRFAIAGRPLRIREIEEATAAIALHVLKDFETTLSEIGAADLVTEEGCLSIYETEAEFAEDREHVELLERYGFEHKVLMGAEIRDYEPALSPKIAKAVLLPDNKSIRDPYRLVLRPPVFHQQRQCRRWQLLTGQFARLRDRGGRRNFHSRRIDLRDRPALDGVRQRIQQPAESPREYGHRDDDTQQHMHLINQLSHSFTIIVRKV